MLDHTYKLLDSQLSQQISLVRKKINNLKDARMLTAAEVCAYVALTLTAIHSLVFLVMICRYCRQHQYEQVQGNTAHPPQPPEVIALREIAPHCADCNLPIGQV